ncbi:signal peptidase I [Thiolapillus sp.]
MGDVKPRRPLIALLLSICPGLGQQYSGKLTRGIVAYTGLVVISWLAAIAYMYVTSRIVGLLLLTVPFLGIAIIAIDAMVCAKRQPLDYRLKWFNRGWIYFAVFAGLFVTVNPLMDYLVGKQIVRAFFVTSGSMYPSLYKHDLVVINKLAKPKRGDIVLIAFKKAQKENASKIIEDQILRRIIAQEGDTIEIKGKRVYLNGNLLDEPYTSFGNTASLNEFVSQDYHLPPETVPPSSYFVLADAREFGFDSRMFGFIQKDEINGVAVKVFWSWNLDGNQFKWERTALNLY